MCTSNTNDVDRGKVLSTDEEKDQKWRSKEETEDRKLAQELQQREEEVAREASEKQMTKSTDGKAVLAVQDIIAAGDPYGHPPHEVTSLRVFGPMTRQAYRWNGLDE